MVDQLFNRAGASAEPWGAGDERLRLDDVYLQGATPEGQAVVGNLSMILDESGLTVLGPTPETRRVVGWDRMSGLEIGPPATMPTGEPVATLQFLLDGRPLRFLVPAAQGAEAGLLTPAEAPVDDGYERGAPPQPGGVSGPEAASEPGVVAQPGAVPDPEVVREPEVVSDPPYSGALLAFDAAPTAGEAVDEAVGTPTRTDESGRTAVAMAHSVDTDDPAETPPTVGQEFPDGRHEQPEDGEASGLCPIPGAWDPVDDAAAVDTPRAQVDFGSEVASGPTDDAKPSPVGDVARLSPAFVYDGRGAELRDGVSVPATFTAGPIDAAQDTPTGRRSQPPRHRRPAPKTPRPGRWYRLVLVTLLVALLPIAAGAWYVHERDNATTDTTQTGVSDAAIASNVGIQRGDVSGWKPDNSRASNAFAAGATTHGHDAAQTAQTAALILARCLRVPVSAVDGAFGLSSTSVAPIAHVGSPAYLDPNGNGGAISSVVDVMAADSVVTSDARVFQNPALFATCYQPYVQAMLPYAGRAGGGGGGFATAVVEPVAVPIPPQGAKAQVVAFQIARIGNDANQTVTEITTAIAIFGGRTQATVDTVSDFVFPVDVENQLVQSIEARVLGVSAL